MESSVAVAVLGRRKLAFEKEGAIGLRREACEAVGEMVWLFLESCKEGARERLLLEL